MQRLDYAFPFRLDLQSRQASQASGYQTHVEDMIKQVLLTAPGERIDLPQFGCGVRKLLFAPNSDALAATTQVMIQQALNQCVIVMPRLLQIVGQSSAFNRSSAAGLDLCQILFKLQHFSVIVGLYFCNLAY